MSKKTKFPKILNTPLRILIKLLPLIASFITFLIITIYIKAQIEGEINAQSLLKLIEINPHLKRSFWQITQIVFWYLAAYALKSCINFPPQIVMFMIAGVLFPLYGAIPLSLAGLLLCLCLPYLYGRVWAPELDGVSKKSRAAKKIVGTLKTENPALFGFFVRIFHLIPGDAASMAAGSLRMNFVGYALGSVVGSLPTIICFALMGRSLGGAAGTKTAMVSLGICMGISVIALLYHIWDRKKSAKLAQVQASEQQQGQSEGQEMPQTEQGSDSSLPKGIDRSADEEKE